MNAEPMQVALLEFLSRDLQVSKMALPMPYLREVWPLQHITRVPLAPPAVVGIVNHNGRIVTVCDPGFYLGVGQQAQQAKQVALLALGDEPARHLALLAWRLGKIVSAPAASPGASDAYIQGHMLPMIDPEKIVQRLNAAVAQASAASMARSRA